MRDSDVPKGEEDGAELKEHDVGVARIVESLAKNWSATDISINWFVWISQRW